MAEHAPLHHPLLDVARWCARAELDDTARAALDACTATPLAWDALPPLLRAHGLTALAVRHLSHVRTRIPPPVWDTLSGQSAEDQARALRMTAELLRIVDALGAEGIAVLPYKGPLLGLVAYGDLALRRSSDLDVLIHPADMARAIAALAPLGYRNADRMSPAQAAWFLRADGDVSVVHDDTGLLVELHAYATTRRLGPTPGFAELWERRKDLQVAGRRVPALDAHDQLLLLALHGTKHGWRKLEWLAGFASLAARNPDALERLIAAAPSGARALRLACALSASLLSVELPERVRHAVAADAAANALAAQVVTHMQQPEDDPKRDDTFERLLFNWRAQDGTRARVRYAWRWGTWPSPEDWQQVRLPDALFPAYRLVRPIRLAWRFGPRALASIFAR
jgi:hypothetical protein